MTSAAEHWAEERWDSSYKGDRVYMRIAIEAFNAGLEHAASLADQQSGLDAIWEQTEDYDRGWYRSARVLAAAIRREQSE